MLNMDDFIKRLELILEYYNLSASAFADKIGVQRSSLSHLLSGRNKPSLDFVIKVVEEFSEVDLYWLLNGKGNFPKSKDVDQKVIVAQELTENQFNASQKNTIDLFTTSENQANSEKTDTNAPKTVSIDDEIERIVVFFTNGTFKNYRP